jgi:hypothetical protein
VKVPRAERLERFEQLERLEPSRLSIGDPRFESVAEGARFELAVHEVDAGFQDRCLKPLGHPSSL